MSKVWETRAEWQTLVETEQQSIYSLAFWLTQETGAAAKLARQGIVSASLSGFERSNADLLAAVVDKICHLFLKGEENNLLVGSGVDGQERKLILRTLLLQEQETRLLVLFHCFLKFDRVALGKKLGWPPEQLNYKLNGAMRTLQKSLLAQDLIGAD